MIWVLFFITVNSQTTIGEFSNEKECLIAREKYTKDSPMDEIFVCREIMFVELEAEKSNN